MPAASGSDADPGGSAAPTDAAWAAALAAVDWLDVALDHGPVALPANAPTPAAPAAEEAAAFPEPAALKPTVPESVPPADGRAFAENDGSCAQQAR